MRRALLAAAPLLLAVAGLACVDGDIPPRPDAAAPSDGGDDGAGGDDGGVGDDGGASDGGAVLLASASPCGGMKLVVSGGALYWTEEVTGKVKSVPTSGGRATVISSNQASPGAIAVDDNWIYWVAADKTLVKRRPLAGGNESVFVPPLTETPMFEHEHDVNALLAKGNVLYVGRFTFAYSIPADGTTLKVLGDSPPSDRGMPGAFALDTTHLYQVEIDHNAVTRESLDGSQNGLLEDGITTARYAPDRIAISQGSLLTDAIGMVDDHVVWANGPSLWRKPGSGAAGGDPSTLIGDTVGENDITGFVVSDSNVYFGEGGTSNTIQVVAAYDGAPRVIATDQLAASQFAADATNIYWRTSDCRIMKLAK